MDNINFTGIREIVPELMSIIPSNRWVPRNDHDSLIDKVLIFLGNIHVLQNSSMVSQSLPAIYWSQFHD